MSARYRISYVVECDKDADHSPLLAAAERAEQDLVDHLDAVCISAAVDGDETLVCAEPVQCEREPQGVQATPELLEAVKAERARRMMAQVNMVADLTHALFTLDVAISAVSQSRMGCKSSGRVAALTGICASLNQQRSALHGELEMVREKLSNMGEVQ